MVKKRVDTRRAETDQSALAKGQKSASAGRGSEVVRDDRAEAGSWDRSAADHRAREVLFMFDAERDRRSNR